MATYAYLRVSTDAQDVQNQKHGVLEYANNNGFSAMEFVEDSVSGKKPWRDRELGKVLEKVSEGDTIIVSEVSRLARSTLQVLEILQYYTEGQINLHIAKNNMRFDNSMQRRIQSRYSKDHRLQADHDLRLLQEAQTQTQQEKREIIRLLHQKAVTRCLVRNKLRYGSYWL